MTSFNEREKSYEKKFALDEELKFKAEQRRNKLLGQWAAAKLGLTGAAVDDYVKAVRKADLARRATRMCSRRSRKTSPTRASACPTASCAKPWTTSWPTPPSRSRPSKS